MSFYQKKIRPLFLVERWIFFFSWILSKCINRSKILSKYDFKSILIIKLDEIGDMATALHIFGIIRDTYPKARITVLCKPICASLIKNDPNINHIINDLKDVQEKFDLHIELRGNFKTLLYSILHCPLIRLDRGSVRFKNKLDGGHPHEVYTNLQIIAPLLQKKIENPVLALYPSIADQGKVKGWLEKKNIQKFIILHCGAGKELRRWPLFHYAEIASYLKNSYSLEIVFAGDKNDQQEIEKVQTLIPFPTYSVAGTFNLSEFAALCKKAYLFIGNESGPMHIASASHIPVIGLFGPGVPEIFYPYGEKCTYIHHVLSCNPCDQIHCVQPDHPCINLITVEEVKEKIHFLLRS